MLYGTVTYSASLRLHSMHLGTTLLTATIRGP
jgi:hypothetical protein